VRVRRRIALVALAPALAAAVLVAAAPVLGAPPAAGRARRACQQPAVGAYLRSVWGSSGEYRGRRRQFTCVMFAIRL